MAQQDVARESHVSQTLPKSTAVCASTNKVIRLNKLSNFVSMSESTGTAAVGTEV